MRAPFRLLPAALGLALAACAGGERDPAMNEADHSDPLMAGALAERIMIDPDLVDRNPANQLAVLAEADGSLPLPDVGVEAASTARDAAMVLIGGSSALRPVPQAQEVAGEVAPAALLSVTARAATVDPALGACAGQAAFSAMWAVRLPQEFPVYPRGAVIEAAGSDAGTCALRAVHFATPVSVEDVLSFYATRAQQAGFALDHKLLGGENALSGQNGGRRLALFVRPGAGGLTLVDLVTAGG